MMLNMFVCVLFSSAVVILNWCAWSALAIGIAPILHQGLSRNRPNSGRNYGASSYGGYGSSNNNYYANSYSNSYYNSYSNNYSPYQNSYNSYVPVQPASTTPGEPIYGSVRSSGTNTHNIRPLDLESPTAEVVDLEGSSNVTSGNTTTTIHRIYANYFQHCVESNGFGIDSDETYMIYGMAPPAPDGVSYRNYTLVSSSYQYNETKVVEAVDRIFTDACFFTVTHQDSRAKLRVTVKNGANVDGNCTQISTSWRWPSGCHLRLYSGSSNSNWLFRSTEYELQLNSQTNCERSFETTQNAVAIEARWCDEEDSISARLNFTILIEPIEGDGSNDPVSDSMSGDSISNDVENSSNSPQSMLFLNLEYSKPTTFLRLVSLVLYIQLFIPD